jgi:hypothetical protein
MSFIKYNDPQFDEIRRELSKVDLTGSDKSSSDWLGSIFEVGAGFYNNLILEGYAISKNSSSRSLLIDKAGLVQSMFRDKYYDRGQLQWKIVVVYHYGYTGAFRIDPFSVHNYRLHLEYVFKYQVKPKKKKSRNKYDGYLVFLKKNFETIDQIYSDPMITRGKYKSFDNYLDRNAAPKKLILSDPRNRPMTDRGNLRIV